MPEFTYNASALGAGGVIYRDKGKVRTAIPSLASVALAPTGGEGRSVLSQYYSEELEFAHAETRVYGSELAGRYTTATYVFIRDLRVFDSLKIAEMKATVTSTRGIDDDDDHEFELKASYQGVRINDVEVAPQIDIQIRDCLRYADVLKLLRKEGRDRQQLVERFGVLDEESRRKFETRVAKNKAIQGSMVKEIRNGEKIGDKLGHKVHVPGLGTVRFGELMLKPGRRRLNLLRIELGANEPEEMLKLKLAGKRGGPEGVQMQQAAPVLMQRVQSDSSSLEGVLDDDYRGSITIASVEGNGSPVFP